MRSLVFRNEETGKEISDENKRDKSQVQKVEVDDYQRSVKVIKTTKISKEILAEPRKSIKTVSIQLKLYK